MLEDTWSVSMKITLNTKWLTKDVMSTLDLFFSAQALLKNRRAYIDSLTPKIGESQIRLGQPVRPGSLGGLTGCAL
jgi:hypothetical protein